LKYGPGVQTPNLHPRADSFHWHSLQPFQDDNLVFYQAEFVDFCIPILFVKLAVRSLFGMACLGFALAIVLANRDCQAGCGDYVFLRNPSGQLVRASSLLKDHEPPCSGPNCPDVDHHVAEGLMHSSPAEHLPIKLPCNGPNCRGESQLPAFPVPPTSSQRNLQESTALLLRSGVDNAEMDERFLRVPLSTGHELRHSQSIFHPPR
jgi:hypothetical protein